MQLNEVQLKTFKMVRTIGFAMLVVAPVAFLGLAYFTKIERQPGPAFQMIFYILLLVGIAQPLLYPVIERSQLGTFRKAQNTKMTSEGTVLNLMIIRMALVESIFLYGLLMVFLGGGFSATLYFYAIGVCWTAVHWPTRTKFENLLQKVEIDGAFTV